jgi:methionine sulfoxide reductase heme-binding subunit
MEAQNFQMSHIQLINGRLYWSNGGRQLVYLLIGLWLTFCVVGMINNGDHLWQQRISEIEGHLSLVCLALTLTTRSLDATFSGLMSQRRYLGLLTFAFALLHTWGAVLHVLGGSLENIWFLSLTMQVEVWLGLVGFIILILLTLTSNNWAIQLLGPNWKRLHKSILIASVLIFIHIIGIGVHYIFTIRTPITIGCTVALLWLADYIWHVRATAP